MKIAVISFSGNVGKSTVARHLLLPRIEGAELIAVESLNADDSPGQALRGRQFGDLQEYLHTVDSVIVDIGASNVEGLLGLMQRYRGSHEDFDFFVVPTAPALKQQQDTIPTLIELAELGVATSPIRVVFNMVDKDADVPWLSATAGLRFPATCGQGRFRLQARQERELRALERFGKRPVGPRARRQDGLQLIVEAGGVADKLALAQRSAAPRDATTGDRRCAGARCVLCGARAGHAAGVTGPSTAREAFIVEALGDGAALLDRIESLTGLDGGRATGTGERKCRARWPAEGLRDGYRSAGAAGPSSRDRSSSAPAKQRSIRSKRKRAVSSAARLAFPVQVDSHLARLNKSLREALQRVDRPWDLWLTQVATAAVSSAVTWWVINPLALREEASIEER